MKRNCIAAALLALTLVMTCTDAANAADVPSVCAKSAILMDAKTGRVLYEKAADEKSLVASTTKIMTGLLVCERGNLDEALAVPQQAVGVEGSSMYLKAGERVTVRDLLYGMMLRSGNDAATALALHLSGSIPAFAAQMNLRAQQLGLTGTHFENPHGLDSEQNYSTARDLARLACAALENETFCQIVSTKTVCAAGRSLTNHNKLLWRYDGAIGVKTGYTMAAGRILVSAAQRDGRTLIAVTIADPDDWRDHARLLDYGFSCIAARVLAEQGQPLGFVRLTDGSEIALTAGETLCVRSLAEEAVTLRLNVPVFLESECAQGQAGTLEAYVDGDLAASIPVYFAEQR